MVTVFTASETELVIRAQNGDRNAFSELVCIHAQGVLNVIYRMCGNAQVAEDATQETFVQAWLHLGSFRPQAALRNWLYRIAINAATDILRREKRILPGALEDLPLMSSHPGPEALLLQSERIVLVQKAILSLSEASRAVIVLREYEEMSYQDISDTLDIPVGTVMSRLSYARKVLKEKLERTLFLNVEVDHVQTR